MKPPEGFTALNWAINNTSKPFDVIGVCVDYLEPARTKGTDFTTQFVLHDPSWHQDSGMRFRFFNHSVRNLPRIQANGDVLMLRNVITKTWNNRGIGMSTSATSWVLLSGSSILESTRPDGTDITFITSSKGYEGAPAPTVAELQYVKEIVSLEDPTGYRPPPRSTALQVESIIEAAGGTPPPRKQKWKLIQDLTTQPVTGRFNFADLFGEVRKTWYNDFGRLQLLITDYTPNKLLYEYSTKSQARDGDSFAYAGNPHENWPGPWGRMTIDVNLFDAHAEYAKSEVKPGMYVLVKNCQIKLDPNGSRLEAACRGDREDISKVNVTIFHPHQAENDQRFKDLLRRRQEYEKLAKQSGVRFGFDRTSRKEDKKGSSGDMEIDHVDMDAAAEQPKKDPKSKRKKRKRGEKTKLGAAKVADTSTTANQYVRCNNINVPLKSIDDILHSDMLKRISSKGNEFLLPFQNCSYKAKVRVVDYYPHNLIDFAVPVLVTDYDVLSDAGTEEVTDLAMTAAQSSPHTVRWEWRFFLIVEDAGPRTVLPGEAKQQMALLVAGDDGDYLLNEEATNLEANPQELAKLREKMFVLWGDLQELKEESTTDGKPPSVKAQSKPFECFINEYGVPVTGKDHSTGDEVDYLRMFRLFGTSI